MSSRDLSDPSHLSGCALDALERLLRTPGERLTLLGGPPDFVEPLLKGLRELQAAELVELEQGFINQKPVVTIHLQRTEARAVFVAARGEGDLLPVKPPRRSSALAEGQARPSALAEGQARPPELAEGIG